MKSKYTFEFMEIDDKVMAVPVGGATDDFKAVLRLNNTAVDILKALESDITESQIVSQLLNKYEIEEEELSSIVHEFVSELISQGIVE